MSKPHLSIASLRGREGLVDCELRAQVVEHEAKTTKEGKPYIRLKLSDGSASEDLSVWKDSPCYSEAEGMVVGLCFAFEARFKIGKYGLETDRTGFFTRLLEGEERTALFLGPPDLRAKQERDWQRMIEIVESLPEGPMKRLTKLLLTQHEEPYRRAAAARSNHHARRGGLVEHVSLMVQSADALCRVYSEIRRDVVVAAIVFHDCGKMIENQYEKEGFVMPFSVTAEAYGHIVIGIEMMRRLWKELPEEDQKDPIQHALGHCIASHHGTLEWGSPVEPKSPEAQLVHFVDNIDAKLEMFRQARKTAPPTAPGVFGGGYPLSKSLLFLDPISSPEPTETTTPTPA